MTYSWTSKVYKAHKPSNYLSCSKSDVSDTTNKDSVDITFDTNCDPNYVSVCGNGNKLNQHEKAIDQLHSSTMHLYHRNGKEVAQNLKPIKVN